MYIGLSVVLGAREKATSANGPIICCLVCQPKEPLHVSMLHFQCGKFSLYPAFALSSDSSPATTLNFSPALSLSMALQSIRDCFKITKFHLTCRHLDCFSHIICRTLTLLAVFNLPSSLPFLGAIKRLAFRNEARLYYTHTTDRLYIDE